MNKIEKLIKEMCPNGVEYKKLGEIFTIRNGYTPSTKNKEFWKNGEISWFRLEDIRCNGRILNEALKKVNIKGVKKNKLFPKESIIISTTATIGEHALIMNDFICNQQFNIFSCKSEIKHLLNIKFYFYYFFIISNHLKNITKNVNLPIINISNLENIEIPILPIEIQNEIVKILDTFTQLEAELEAELEARDKQYQYYRNKLLDFDNNQKLLEKLFEKDIREIDNKIEYEKLKNISNFRRGSFPQPYGLQKWYDEQNGKPFVQVCDLLDDSFSLKNNTKQHISFNAEKYSVFVPQDSVVVSIQGTIGRVAITQYDSYVDRTILIFTNISNLLNKKYFVYILHNKFQYEKQFSHGSVLKTITKEEISEFSIPIPSLEVQTKIVNILDKLQDYSKDIKTGLPLEIEQRQKQYEYYRNLLLDFKANAQGGGH